MMCFFKIFFFVCLSPPFGAEKLLQFSESFDGKVNLVGAFGKLKLLEVFKSTVKNERKMKEKLLA